MEEMNFDQLRAALMTAEYRNPVYTETGTVVCEIMHPQYGWTPFHATPDDSEAHGREIYARIVADGNIAPYVPEPVVTPLPSPEEQKIAELEARLARVERLARFK